MIVYANGDSHTAAAEAVNTFAFAADDPLYWGLGRQPHPDNLQCSYACEIANNFGAILHTDAESASSNDRILRTTKEYLKTIHPDLLIIGWSTWERQEYTHTDGVTYQFGNGWNGNDWPAEVVDRYKQWVADLDIDQQIQHWHKTIHEFHKELQNSGVRHLFFNTFLSFNYNFITPYDWGDNYLAPYSNSQTFYHWLADRGFSTVNPNSYHYAADAQRRWAEYLMTHLTKLI